LQFQRHVADFVKEDGAAVSQLEAPDLPVMSSGEGSEVQLTVIMGRSLRALRRWMASATTPLPVPVSPRRSTVASWGATCSTRNNTCDRALLCPMISPKLCFRATSCRR
jgi:hypothetical protein